MGDHYAANIRKTNCDRRKKKKSARKALARCPREGSRGKGVSSPDMHIYFVSMEAFVATLTTAGSPRTCVSVEQRGETKSARENSESTLARTCTHPFLSSYISIRSDAGRIEVATVYRKCHGSSTTDSRGVRRSDRALPASVGNNLSKQRGSRRALMRHTKATEDSSQGTFAWAYMYSDSLAL